MDHNKIQISKKTKSGRVKKGKGKRIDHNKLFALLDKFL